MKLSMSCHFPFLFKHSWAFVPTIVMLRSRSESVRLLRWRIHQQITGLLRLGLTYDDPVSFLFTACLGILRTHGHATSQTTSQFGKTIVIKVMEMTIVHGKCCGLAVENSSKRSFGHKTYYPKNFRTPVF